MHNANCVAKFKYLGGEAQNPNQTNFTVNKVYEMLSFGNSVAGQINGICLNDNGDIAPAMNLNDLIEWSLIAV